MKKILAMFLSATLLCGCFTAFADSTVAEDAKPIYFNDFENCTFTQRIDATRYSFMVVDSGEEAHGKVFESVSINNGWGSIEGGKQKGTYVKDGVTYDLFNEALTPNTDYIMDITYKTIGNEVFSSTAAGALSFAPQILGSVFDYKNNGSDYKYYLAPVNDWTKSTVLFNSHDAETMNIKFNVQGSNVTTWIDNYGVYKPTKITVKGMDVELNIIDGIYTDGYVAIGVPLKVSVPDGLTITSATMGGEAVEITDDVLDVDVVTGEIELNVSSELKALNENYIIKDGFIYVPKFEPAANFINRALANETYTFVDSEGDAKTGDGIIRSSDKLSVKVNDSNYQEFGFKYCIDTTGTDNYNVTDLVYIMDCVLGYQTYEKENDINGNGRLTVSDLVLARYTILNNAEVEIDAEKLAAEKAKIEEDAVTYGITDRILEESVANMGNRTRVANVMKKALRGENITIATIGGSITEGTGITIADGRAEKCWAALMADWWKRMFPGQVTFVNAGISGTNSNFGLYRLADDVLSHDPDILFIEFAANDGAQRGSIRSCQEALILKMLERGDAAVQMFFTTVGYNGDGGQLTYQPLGQYYDIPQISPRDAFWGEEFHAADGKVYSHFKDTEGTGLSIANDGTHPNIRGNAMVSVLTNNYLNSVYENLNKISNTPNAIPEETFEDDTPNYMNLVDFDAGLTTESKLHAGGKITLTDYGCFTPCTDSTTFRSTCTPMYGVEYKQGEIAPMVLDVDDCHVFGIVNQVSYTGYKFTVEVFEQGTDKLITSTELSSQHSSESMARNHGAAFESLYGTDVTIKITPVADSGDSLTIRNIYVS